MIQRHRFNLRAKESQITPINAASKSFKILSITICAMSGCKNETATGTVTAPAIVIALDIIKHRRPHDFPADKALTVDTFHLQRMEEAFRTGIIVTATLCTHAAVQVMPLQERLIIR